MTTHPAAQANQTSNTAIKKAYWARDTTDSFNY
jgi:hypothetical protein